MSLFGVTTTLAGAQRLAARPPQLALGDLEGGQALEPGRPLRVIDARGQTLAVGAADPENEVVRLWEYGDGARALDAAFFRARLAPALALRQTLGLADGQSAYRLLNAEGD